MRLPCLHPRHQYAVLLPEEPGLRPRQAKAGQFLAYHAILHHR